MQFKRQELIFGEEGMKKLKDAHVLIFGVGGVGGFTVEALVRSGIGEITVVDFASVDITNLNRQIIATYDTIDRVKVDVIKERASKINKDIKINTFNLRYNSSESDRFFSNDKRYDYVVDAIDLVEGKLSIIKEAKKLNIPIISSMGMGNKLDPTLIKVDDIKKTHTCPLARVIRQELKKARVKKVKVVFSSELPRKPKNESGSRKKSVNVGSVAFVPSVAGLIIGSVVVRDIVGE